MSSNKSTVFTAILNTKTKDLRVPVPVEQHAQLDALVEFLKTRNLEYDMPSLLVKAFSAHLNKALGEATELGFTDPASKAVRLGSPSPASQQDQT